LPVLPLHGKQRLPDYASGGKAQSGVEGVDHVLLAQ